MPSHLSGHIPLDVVANLPLYAAFTFEEVGGGRLADMSGCDDGCSCQCTCRLGRSSRILVCMQITCGRSWYVTPVSNMSACRPHCPVRSLMHEPKFDPESNINGSAVQCMCMQWHIWQGLNSVCHPAGEAKQAAGVKLWTARETRLPCQASGFTASCLCPGQETGLSTLKQD